MSSTTISTNDVTGNTFDPSQASLDLAVDQNADQNKTSMPRVKRKIKIDCFVFYWKPVGTHGCLSRWYRSTFVCDGRQFATAERYMLYKKPELFNDTEIMDMIMRKPDAHPAEHKQMGRRVQNFTRRRGIRRI